MYRIRNWAKHFETNDTRKLVNLHWVKIPNQQDSLAYRTIANHQKGSAIFCAWILMVQVASKQSPRGNLPLSPEELGIITGFPADIFKLAFEVLKSPKIQWIEQNPDNLPESPDASGYRPENPPLNGKKEGMEGNTDPQADIPELGNSKRWGMKTKHSFQRSPVFPYQLFSEAFKEWGPEKIAHYHAAAIEYSDNKGGRYLDWHRAISCWERDRPWKGKINGAQPVEIDRSQYGL